MHALASTDLLRKMRDSLAVRTLLLMLPLFAFVAFAALSLSSTTAFAADTAQMGANKKAVLAFCVEGINKKDFEAAAKYFGPKYIQHSPTEPDGIDGFRTFAGFLKEKFPNLKSEVKGVFADGDLVILHVHAVREPGARGAAIVDTFRLENAKIAEHWGVRQDIPEKAANANGVF
jgi:predicted SnoaL-like aldol condensation-catalyzing enzyme